MSLIGYDLGDVIRCSGSFVNSASTAIDPTNVYAKIKVPSGTITTYTYGVDAELVKDSVGNYHVDVDASTSGTFLYRFYSTGTGQAAEEAAFVVEPSLLV